MNTMGNLEKRVAEFAEAECTIFLAIWDVVSKQNRDMSETDKLVGPSIEILLSSKKTISLFNFRCPAKLNTS